jgi:5-methylcytosine-specific restriction endonuclease McrA
MSRLSVELVPRTAWWKNVRSNVSKSDWEKAKRYARAKTPGGCCFICGGSGYEQGKNYPSEAHEIWAYDDDRQIQTLVDIVPLCPKCHQCKHLGRTRAVSNLHQWTKVIEHFKSVNDWDDDRVERYIQIVFQIHEMRSEMKWKLDISFLQTLGIKPIDT